MSKLTGCFGSADILLPDTRKADFSRWAVIACDQFTSQPDYWREVARLTESVPSASHLILPEAELEEAGRDRIDRIHREMLRFLQDGILRNRKDCFIYTERRLHSGMIRHGIVGKLDLEAYDYGGEADVPVRATEKTVTERIPPRMAVRRGAALELPHILLLCDDGRNLLIETLAGKKDSLQKLYDFDLMLGGGHVSGWLVSGAEKAALEKRLLEYEAYEREKNAGAKLVYAVGDGNHSLATAKACYEELKRQNPGRDLSAHPARYALCELNNIHEESQRFEPIHRLVKNCDPQLLIRDLMQDLDAPGGTEIPWISGSETGLLRIRNENGLLPLSVLQDYLDRWLGQHGGELDYIHGEAALAELSRHKNCIGFRLPAIDKNSLFGGILSGGVLPRKTFSMGEAEEKRYYLEARIIAENVSCPN